MVIEKINVILCCYQGEAYIAEQLDSILAQDYPSIDIYVSDDGSVDSTTTIVSAYCAKFSHITLHKNSKNIGFLKNFETSLARVKGEYFALCDQDDIWQKDKLSLSMQALKLAEVNHPDKPILVHSDLDLISAEGEMVGSTFFYKKGLSFSENKSLGQVLGHCGIMGNTILMNKKLIDIALPFPESLKYHDYWFALINECFGIRCTISKSLVKYRLHQSNTSNNNLTKKAPGSLPFMQDNRIATIKDLLGNYDLSQEDRLLIGRFYSYLMFEANRFSHFMFLFRNGFFKRGFLYRANAFLKIMLTKY